MPGYNKANTTTSGQVRTNPTSKKPITCTLCNIWDHVNKNCYITIPAKCKIFLDKNPDSKAWVNKRVKSHEEYTAKIAERAARANTWCPTCNRRGHPEEKCFLLNDALREEFLVKNPEARESLESKVARHKGWVQRQERNAEEERRLNVLRAKQVCDHCGNPHFTRECKFYLVVRSF